MGYYFFVFIITAGLLFASCDTEKQQEHEPHGEGTAFTIWTGNTELFAEFPQFITGQPGSVAFHLTDLNAFEPVVTGRVKISTFSGAGTEFETVIEKPSSPGIYRADLRFKKSGKYTMKVIVESTGNDTITVANIVVHDPGEEPAHIHAADAEGPVISFLKEQQWNTEFRTEPVKRGLIAATLRVTGEVIPRSRGEALVTAPFSGYCPVSASKLLKTPGTMVTKNQLLMTLIPSVENQAGSADFASRLADVLADRDVAAAEVERSRLLYEKDLISKKEYQETEAEWRRAETSYNALRNAVRSAGEPGDNPPDGGYRIASPMSGTLAQVFVTPGKQVQAGDPLFHIVDTRMLWLRTNIPMTEARRFKTPRLIAMQIPGANAPFMFDSLSTRRVSIGAVIDDRTRSIAAVFEFPNTNGLFTIGLTGSAYLAAGTYTTGLAVPVHALLEDEGQYFVYVQLGGESFVRRNVTLGSRMGNSNEILSGLTEGDHVVTVGATQVRLAGSSSSLPEHGHAH